MTLSRLSLKISDLPPVWKTILVWLIISALSIYAYIGSLDIELLSYDQLIHLDFVRVYGAFGGFSNPRAAGDLYALQFNCVCVYRPFFIVQMGLLYQFFGLHHTGYRIVMLGLHILNGGVLFTAFHHLTRRQGLSLIIAAFFATHPILSEHVLWVSDTNPWLNLLSALMLILLLHPRRNGLWYAALFAIVSLAPLLRENGLALPAGLLIFALIAHRGQSLARRQTIMLAGVAVAAILLYVTLRTLSIGFLPQNFTNIHTDSSSNPSAPVYLQFATNILTYVAAIFFPLFNYSGYLESGLLLLSIYSLIGLGLLYFVLTNFRTRPRWLIVFAAMIGLLIAAVTLRLGLQSGLTSLADQSRYVLQTLLSLGLLVGLWFSIPRWTPLYRALAALAVTLILISGGAAFIYFRYRNLNLALIGWLLLLVLFLTSLDDFPRRRLITATASAGLIMALLLNAYFIHISLPWALSGIENFRYSALCDRRVSESLALDYADHYHLDHGDVLACREEALPDTP